MTDQLEEIMRSLSEAKRQAEAINEPLLAYHIGTALLVAQERSMERGDKGRRR